MFNMRECYINQLIKLDVRKKFFGPLSARNYT